MQKLKKAGIKLIWKRLEWSSYHFYWFTILCDKLQALSHKNALEHNVNKVKNQVFWER